MQVHKDRFHRGYLPLGTTKYPGKPADLKDSFDIGVDLPLTHPMLKEDYPCMVLISGQLLSGLKIRQSYIFLR